MIYYQVSITLEPGIDEDWLDWMRRVHVPDVLKTGCFTRCTMARQVEPASERATFVFRYEAPSREAYERYRAQFAPAMQQDHTARYAGRFQGSRMVLEVVTTFVP